MFTEPTGTNTIRATMDDTLGLFTLLDAHKVELPCYVVMDIRRVPAIDSKVDVDLSVVAKLTAMANDLCQQVSVLSDKVDMLTCRLSATAVSAPVFDVIQQPTSGVSSVTVAQHVETVPKSWVAFQPAMPSLRKIS